MNTHVLKEEFMSELSVRMHNAEISFMNRIGNGARKSENWWMGVIELIT
jgi:hypothetical protein